MDQGKKGCNRKSHRNPKQLNMIWTNVYLENNFFLAKLIYSSLDLVNADFKLNWEGF